MSDSGLNLNEDIDDGGDENDDMDESKKAKLNDLTNFFSARPADEENEEAAPPMPPRKKTRPDFEEESGEQVVGKTEEKKVVKTKREKSKKKMSKVKGDKKGKTSTKLDKNGKERVSKKERGKSKKKAKADDPVVVKKPSMAAPKGERKIVQSETSEEGETTTDDDATDTEEEEEETEEDEEETEEEEEEEVVEVKKSPEAKKKSYSPPVSPTKPVTKLAANTAKDASKLTERSGLLDFSFMKRARRATQNIFNPNSAVPLTWYPNPNDFQNTSHRFNAFIQPKNTDLVERYSVDYEIPLPPPSRKKASNDADGKSNIAYDIPQPVPHTVPYEPKFEHHQASVSVVKINRSHSIFLKAICGIIALGYLVIFLIGWAVCLSENKDKCLEDVDYGGVSLGLFFALAMFWVGCGLAVGFACPQFEWGAFVQPGLNLYKASRPPVILSFWGVELAYFISNILFSVVAVFSQPTKFASSGPSTTPETVFRVLDEFDGRDVRQLKIGTAISLALTAFVHIVYKFRTRKKVSYQARKAFWAGSIILIGLEDFAFITIKGIWSNRSGDPPGKAVFQMSLAFSYFMVFLRIFGSIYSLCCSQPMYSDEEESSVLLIETIPVPHDDAAFANFNQGATAHVERSPMKNDKHQIMIMDGNATQKPAQPDHKGVVYKRLLPGDEETPYGFDMETRIRRLNQFESLALRNTQTNRLRLVKQPKNFERIMLLVGLLLISLFVAASVIGGKADPLSEDTSFTDRVLYSLVIFSGIFMLIGVLVLCCVRGRNEGCFVTDHYLAEAVVEHRRVTGFTLLEAADFLTDIGSTAILLPVFATNFRILMIASLVVTAILLFVAHCVVERMPHSFSKVNAKVLIGLFICASEDLIMIPINVLYVLEIQFSDIKQSNVEFVAVAISALLGFLLLIARTWRTVVHAICGQKPFNGNVDDVQEFLHMEDKFNV